MLYAGREHALCWKIAQSEKVEKISGKGLSTNDYTNEDKLKLSQLPSWEEYLRVLNSKADSDEIPIKLSELQDDISVEKTKNKVMIIDGDITDESYPSAKAVESFVRMEADALRDGYRLIPLSTFIDDTGEVNGRPIALATFAHSTSEAGHAMSSDESTRALEDVQGRTIHETYATKQELLEAIGEALEGEY